MTLGRVGADVLPCGRTDTSVYTVRPTNARMCNVLTTTGFLKRYVD